MGLMRGCSSQSSPGEIHAWSPGPVILLEIRSPLCSRAVRRGDARNACVSSTAEGSICRRAQSAVRRSWPAGSRKVNSSSLSFQERIESHGGCSGDPVTDLANPRHPRCRAAFLARVWLQHRNGRVRGFSGANTIRWLQELIQQPVRPAGQCQDRRRHRQGARTKGSRPEELRRKRKHVASSCGL